MPVRPRRRARASSLSPSGFYGWHIVGWSALMVAMTAPGQTAAVSVFIDPMISDLGVGRSAISTAYLVGTLTGALAMPLVGRMLDRFGVRRVVSVIGLVFAAGQGALGLAATTAVALWFTRRRGTAMGLVSAIGASAISLAPVGLELLVSGWGWRRAWLAEGILVALIVLPVAWFAMRDRPADLGQHPEGDIPDAGTPPAGQFATSTTSPAATQPHCSDHSPCPPPSQELPCSSSHRASRSPPNTTSMPISTTSISTTRSATVHDDPVTVHHADLLQRGVHFGQSCGPPADDRPPRRPQ